MTEPTVSVIIPARNEIYLQRTIESILSAAEGNIEILVMLDGYIPDPQIVINDDRVIFKHFKESIGQRACVNYGANIAKGKYVLKTDAHSMFDEGFDIKLVADCEYDWTVIPRMYNLDADNWKPKLHKRTDYMYISNAPGKKLRADYYQNNGLRQPTGPDIDDVMTGQGACFFMHKDRYWELGGLDESHGGWGQVGIEVACKAWLSGGSLKVNKKTWFSHWFRGHLGGFPYPISGKKINEARRYSRDLWLNDKWEKQILKRPFSWIIAKFNAPGWVTDLTLLFYTANVVSDKIMNPVVRSLKRHGFPIISVSQKPMNLGTNIFFEGGRSLQNVYRQVLIAAKASKTEYVALCEDDCLYKPEHFKQRPNGVPFIYNLNRWLLHLDQGVYSYRKRPILSQLIAHRETLIKHLEEKLALSEIPDKYCGEPGVFDSKLGITKYPFETFSTKEPNLIICHDKGFGRKLIGKDACPKNDLESWGPVTYWVKKFKNTLKTQISGGLRSQFEKVRVKQYLHIVGQPLNVMDLCDNRMKLCASGRRYNKSLRWFIQVFPPFIKSVHEGTTFSTAELLKQPYFKYLVSKLNPIDRIPVNYVKKGERHCVNLMKNAITLYHNIKENGLHSPLDMWRSNNKLVLHRGGRRLEILKLLGWETVPCRIFNSKELYNNHIPDKHIIQNNSIHSLAARQFMKLKDRATDKYWIHNYTKLYDKHIGYLRDTPLKILEIGVFRGASLLLWKEAFPKSKIYGIDKNTRIWQKLLKNQDRIKVCVGRQENTDFLQNTVVPNGPFDIIIDDGGHHPLPMQTSFKVLWANLNKGGIYVIEDLYGNYRKEFIETTTIRMLKSMIDEMNIQCTIKSMSFYYNICFIEKN